MAAGLLQSVANVRGPDALRTAVFQVLRSALSPAYLRYRRDRGRSPQPPCPAALVQRYIDARATGVLTTQDMIRGDPDYMVIQAARGVAGGERTRGYAVIRIRRQTNTIEEFVEDLLPDGVSSANGAAVTDEERLRCQGIDLRELRRVIELGQAVESAVGAPVGAEWCIDEDGAPHLLQVQPMTNELTHG